MDKVLPKIIEAYTAYGTSGVVVATNPTASYIGLKILEKTGNVVDAGIATSLALCVTEPHVAGLGGDLVALVFKDNNVKVFMGVGKAPSKLTLENLYSKGFTSVPRYGPLSILVPGLVDTIRLLHKYYSKTSLQEIVSPIIDIAKRGLPADKKLIELVKTMHTHISRDPQTVRAYMYRGSIPSIGDRLEIEFLDESLKKIAEDPRSFYEGEIAELIVKHVKRRGGVLELEDLASYYAKVVEPLKITIDNKYIYEAPPPSRGVLVLAATQVLSKTLSRSKTVEPYTPSFVELLVESYRKTIAIREKILTDPSKLDDSIEEIISSGSISNYLIDMHEKRHGSAGFIVATVNGDLMVGTQSLYMPFGSGITVRRTGITLNAGVSLFDSTGINRLEPGKSPITVLSSPIIVDKNQVVGFSGRGGGFKQQFYYQVIVKNIFFGEDLPIAIGSPRLRYNSGLIVDVEEGYMDVVKLDTRKYHIHIYPYPSAEMGLVNASRILLGKGVVEALADPRDTIGVAVV